MNQLIAVNIFLFKVNYSFQLSSKRSANLTPFNGRIFIQLCETDDFGTPKIELNNQNSVKNNEPFMKDEPDDFEIFTWKLNKIQFIKLSLQSDDDVEEIFIKFLVLNLPENKGKL